MGVAGTTLQTMGTPPQAVVMTLAHNHETKVCISSYRGATVIKFGW